MAESIQPTKKQKELLNFIEEFINSHGYSPSYREVMQGLNYTSVATVSLHITNLISRGHLGKRNRSARSLYLIKPNLKINGVKTELIDRIWNFKNIYPYEKV